MILASQPNIIVTARQKDSAIEYDPNNYNTPININVRFEIMIGDTTFHLNKQDEEDHNASISTNQDSIAADEDACTLLQKVKNNEKDNNIDLINILIRKVCSNERHTRGSQNFLQDNKDKDMSSTKNIQIDRPIFNPDKNNEEFNSYDEELISSLSSQSNIFDINTIPQNKTEENKRIVPKKYSFLTNNHPPYQSMNLDRSVDTLNSEDELSPSQFQQFKKSSLKRKRLLASSTDVSLSLSSRACKNDVCECDSMDRMTLDPSRNEREKLIFEIIQESPAANLTKYLDLPSDYDSNIPVDNRMISIYSQLDVDRSFLLSKQLMQSVCWTLKDDPNIMYGFSLKQRFILSSIYFFTTIPTASFNLQSTWANHLNFLSEKHECLWNAEAYHTTNDTFSSIAGVECLNSNKVSRLLLGNNKLMGIISPLISQLLRITHIDFSHNYLKHLVLPIQELDYLMSIDVSHNLFLGNFPPWDGGRLESLDLSGNAFSGTLPAEKILKHVALKSFDISDNFFTGEIPALNLSNLQILRASNNLFVDFKELNNGTTFDSLQVLDLSKNMLKGTLPENMCKNYPNLQHLNLQGNELSGTIPRKFGLCSKLETLALSHNWLRDDIPSDLEKMSNLKVLYLNDNDLAGKAPSFLNGSLDDYVTDCLESVECETCTICCDELETCQQTSVQQFDSRIWVGVVLSCFACLQLLAFVTSLIYNYKKDHDITVADHKKGYWLIGESTFYILFCTRNYLAWIVGLVACASEIIVYGLFIQSGLFYSERSFWENSWTCTSDELACSNSLNKTPFGWYIFITILIVFLAARIISIGKLCVLSGRVRRIDFFFISLAKGLTTSVTIGASTVYNVATAENDTEMVVNAVILLFIHEMDTKIFSLIDTLNSTWIKNLLEQSDQSIASHATSRTTTLSRG